MRERWSNDSQFCKAVKYLRPVSEACGPEWPLCRLRGTIVRAKRVELQMLRLHVENVF